MVTMKQGTGNLARGGFYLVATKEGDLRALVDEKLTMRMPSIRRVVTDVGEILSRAFANGVAVSVKFECAPEASGMRTPAMNRDNP